MMERPLRVLLVITHPIQYASPLFRLYAKEPSLEILVAYCSLPGAESHVDREFGVEVKWDIPLLEELPLDRRSKPLVASRVGIFLRPVQSWYLAFDSRREVRFGCVVYLICLRDFLDCYSSRQDEWCRGLIWYRCSRSLLPRQ